MKTRDELVHLFAALAGALTVASVIGFALKRGRSPNAPHGAIDNLNARVKAWWVMIAVLATAFFLGKAGTITLFFVISMLGLREYVSVAETRRADRAALWVAFGAVVPAQYILVWSEWYGLYSIFIPVYAFLLLPIVAAASADTTRFLERTSNMQWGLMVTTFCLSHVPALLSLDIDQYEGRNILLIFFLVLVVQASDVLQYIWGKLTGRHKIAPEVSPSKTVEGFLGGVASSSLLGAALHGLTPFTPVQALLYALAINLMGFFGGLVMSAIKRDRGVKDWGNLIEGHGGILDRVDSICFAAPVFFHLVRYYWT